MTLAMSRSTADSNLLYSCAQLRDPRNQPTENSRLLVGSLGTFGPTQLNLLLILNPLLLNLYSSILNSYNLWPIPGQPNAKPIWGPLHGEFGERAGNP